MPIFENRFTEKAENALRYAQESAQQMGHNYVGTEHILIGLLKEGEGVDPEPFNLKVLRKKRS